MDAERIGAEIDRRAREIARIVAAHVDVDDLDAGNRMYRCLEEIVGLAARLRSVGPAAVASAARESAAPKGQDAARQRPFGANVRALNEVAAR